MARAASNLKIQLSDIVCHDEADGIGDAEPYLWPVFFKIDGDTFAVDAVGLIGFPKVFTTNGAHGNLGDTDVSEGDRVFIPEAVGRMTTPLKPIPVNDPTFRMLLGDDLPGIAGAVVVLMEEDGWPDEIATAAYSAMIDAVHLGVAKAAASFQNTLAAPSKEEIDAQIALIKTTVGKMVRGAVLEHMTGRQIAWYGTFGNNDDRIGTEAWTVNQDDFAGVNSKTFERRWNDDESEGNGDWSILDGPPPVVDTSQCAKIAEEIKALQEDLKGDIDINERKRILQEIGELTDKSQRIGCPQV